MFLKHQDVIIQVADFLIRKGLTTARDAELDSKVKQFHICSPKFWGRVFVTGVNDLLVEVRSRGTPSVKCERFDSKTHMMGFIDNY
jgi:hypothetical protein